jgi:hypothetical protein
MSDEMKSRIESSVSAMKARHEEAEKLRKQAQSDFESAHAEFKKIVAETVLPCFQNFGELIEQSGFKFKIEDKSDGPRSSSTFSYNVKFAFAQDDRTMYATHPYLCVDWNGRGRTVSISKSDMIGNSGGSSGGGRSLGFDKVTRDGLEKDLTGLFEEVVRKL